MKFSEWLNEERVQVRISRVRSRETPYAIYPVNSEEIPKLSKVDGVFEKDNENGNYFLVRSKDALSQWKMRNKDKIVEIPMPNF